MGDPSGVGDGENLLADSAQGADRKRSQLAFDRFGQLKGSGEEAKTGAAEGL